MLRKAELRVLIALHDDPIGDVNSLSKRAGVAPATFVRNLKKLQADGILGSHQERGQTEGFVSAQICYSAVGLEEIAVIMSVPRKNLERVEEMCEAQPYVAYTARCLGSTNGVFATFAVPINSSYLLFDLLDILEEKRIIGDYAYRVQANLQVSTETNFRFYNRRTGTWGFNWEDWGKTSREEDATPELEPMRRSVLHKMGAEDLRILTQLSSNSRKEKKRIAKEIGIPGWQLSRRLAILRANGVIDGYRILWGPSPPNPVMQPLIDCEAPAKIKAQVACAFSKLPFQASFIPTEKGFVLNLALPASDFPKLADALLEQVGEANLMLCDHGSSIRYCFDRHKESSYRNGEWLATRDYMVDKVLRDKGLE